MKLIEICCSFIFKLYKMLNLDKIVNNKNEDEDLPFRMLIIGPSG